MSMKKYNAFLREHGILIKRNPCVSPDFCLDALALTNLIKCLNEESFRAIRSGLRGKDVYDGGIVVHAKSEFWIEQGAVHLAESEATGDCAYVVALSADPDPRIPFTDTESIESRENGRYLVVPCTWENLIVMKNLVQEFDPYSTIFPTAAGPLGTQSIGIGARFTTLHWPAVDWAMAHLNLPMTANQNSIPRELIYDIDKKLSGDLEEVWFPFIGSSIPEGHQGQSVQGMTHGAVIEKLRHGFHRRRIPWGFNADHQPVGGKFEGREEKLVEGSLFASYITFDVSPELSTREKPADADEARKYLQGEEVDAEEMAKEVRNIMAAVGVAEDGGSDDRELHTTFAWIHTAVAKLKRRNELCERIREKHFSTSHGRRFFRELSIDELAGVTQPSMLCAILVMCRREGLHFDFVAPAFGFQKNSIYADNVVLGDMVSAAHKIAAYFKAAIGFHSGSGKSLENYVTCAEHAEKHLEIKTSGRYTYEMGRALVEAARDGDTEAGRLWKDWYSFTVEVALAALEGGEGAQKELAREFVMSSLPGFEGTGAELASAVRGLEPSPDHMHWFEFNFLYVLAASLADLRREAGGSHTERVLREYAQRERFYAVSDRVKLKYSKNVVRYLVFLAVAVGFAEESEGKRVLGRLDALEEYEELLEGIGPDVGVCVPPEGGEQRVVVMEKPGKMKMTRGIVPVIPEGKKGQALCKVHAIGICGTDTKAFIGKQAFFNYPRVVGHELGVEVVSVGTGRNTSGRVHVGDRCSVEPYMQCGECVACRMGKYNCCERISVLGVHIDGGHCEYLVLPQEKLHPSAILSYEELALVETLCICSHALKRSRLLVDHTRDQYGATVPILILGGGAMGYSLLALVQAILQTRKDMDIDVYLADVDGERLRYLREVFPYCKTLDIGSLGREEVEKALRQRLGGDLPVLVFEASGNVSSLCNTIYYVSHGGTLVLIGHSVGTLEFFNPDIHKKELNVFGSRNATAEDFKFVISLLESGTAEVAHMITHRGRLDDAEELLQRWTSSSFSTRAVEGEKKYVKGILTV